MMEKVTLLRLFSSAIRPASVLGAFLCLLLTSAAFAAPYQINETFDVDPGWDGFQNQTPDNDFGWSNTNNTGAPSGAGELGGTLARDPRGWYADDIGVLDASTDALSMSGTMVINFDANNDGASYLGWFDADDLGNESYPEHWMGFRLQNDPPFQVRILWTTGGPLGQEVAANEGTDWDNGVAFPFEFSYDPSANSGNGQIVAQVGTAAPVISNLGLGDKDIFPDFDHWGLISSNFPDSFKLVEVFIDDVTYTSNAIPEPASITLIGLALLALGARRRSNM